MVAQSAESQAVVPYEEPHLDIVRPLLSPQEARLAMAEYEKLKSAMALDSDWVRGSDGRKYLKKSFWRRLASYFGLSLSLVHQDRIVEPDGAVRYEVIYRATAPNGRSMDGDGTCASTELVDKWGKQLPWSDHQVRSRAHTRAKNRAISDLVGGGEVSADELRDLELSDGGADEARREQRTTAKAQTQTIQQQMQNIVRRAHDVGCEKVVDFAKVFGHYTGKEWGAKGLTVTQAEVDILRNWVISREVRKERGEALPSIDEELGERVPAEMSA